MKPLLTRLLLLGLTAGSIGLAVPVSLSVQLNQGTAPLSWKAFYETPSQASYNLETIKFFISNLALVNQEGKERKIPGIFLLSYDQQTGKTRAQIKFDAPAGKYAGLRFEVGVPREQNHQDAALAKKPLGVETGMYWAWNYGYIFFRYEGRVKIADKLEPLVLHMGSEAYRMSIDLADLENYSKEISIPKTGASINLGLDLSKVFSGNSLDLNIPANRVMHFSPAIGSIYQNLLGAFSIISVTKP